MTHNINNRVREKVTVLRSPEKSSVEHRQKRRQRPPFLAVANSKSGRIDTQSINPKKNILSDIFCFLTKDLPEGRNVLPDLNQSIMQIFFDVDN